MRMANLAGRALSGFLISSHSIRTKRRRFADHSANRPVYAGPQCQDQTLQGCVESEMTKPIDKALERCTQTRSAVRGQSRVASSSPIAHKLASEFHVPVRHAERAVSEAVDSISPDADIPHREFLVESRARMTLFRASLGL